MSRKQSLYLSMGSMFVFVTLYLLTSTGIIGFNPVGEAGSYGAPLVVPEAYAFTIWAPIYLFLIAFPIFQLLKKQEADKSWNEIRVWYSFNVIANGLWLVFASYDWQIGTLLLIVFMLISLFKINGLLLKLKSNGAKVNFWFERIGFSLYFGWITLATALNVSTALKFYQWQGFGISEVSWSLLILSVAALIAAATFWKYRDTAYALVVVWAFTALIVKHLNFEVLIAYLSMAIVTLFIGLILTNEVKTLKARSVNDV
ncbi:hypothetical protein [Poritiphilus flavus]|uniref:Tryptophan-rich sensory protein n=1 Tax=Poritiphilus flavus TaxID=2697053 RepID=A0A6L9EGT4_9FLAO|nr:hypothetical protein [Poritiphilus flavus]NAS13895.1 hypothetical protein [Poritiphilus flavus]